MCMCTKCERCDICAYSASDHNTLRRHRMRHTGQKPYRCALCSYTAIQTISLKTHMRTKHPYTATTSCWSTTPAAGATTVYSCQLCRYQTVNHPSWLHHFEQHHHHRGNNSNTASTPISNVELATSSNEQLLVIQNDNSNCELVVAPLVDACTNNDNNPNAAICSAAASLSVEGIEPQPTDSRPTDQHGLRHILTAISQQQHTTIT